MGDVALETKALYCTEYIDVNAGVTRMESGYTYPGRSAGDYSLEAEVSRGHSKQETSHHQNKG
jgi:hypothetical protein